MQERMSRIAAIRARADSHDPEIYAAWRIAGHFMAVARADVIGLCDELEQARALLRECLPYIPNEYDDERRIRDNIRAALDKGDAT